VSWHSRPTLGEARRRARESLINLLLGAVGLGIAIEAVLNLVPWPADALAGRWYAVFGIGIVVVPALVYWVALSDDRRIGPDETYIEFILPYRVRDGGRAVRVVRRTSYAITRDARQAWTAYAGRSFSRPTAGSFVEAIQAEHIDLVRYLIAIRLARFGRYVANWGGWRLGLASIDLPTMDVPWGRLPAPLRDNPFSAAIGTARPRGFTLPIGATFESPRKEDELLRLRWYPPGRWPWRAWCRVLGIGRHPPGVDLVVRWLPPLARVRPRDKPVELLTAREDPLREGEEMWALRTRLLVEVHARWNAIDAVQRFRDWCAVLAAYLRDELDYHTWRSYLGRRTVEDLDWKIGYIRRREEPGLVARLERLDERLARLEAHLWPDEPPQGEGPGAWLSGGEGA